MRCVQWIRSCERGQPGLGRNRARRGHGGLPDIPLSAHRLPGGGGPPRSHNEDQERLLPCLMNATRNWLLNSDGVEHLRLRKLLRGVWQANRRRCGRTYGASSRKRQFMRSGSGDIEFVADVARRIPARTILHLLDFRTISCPGPPLVTEPQPDIGNVNVAMNDLLEVERTLLDLRSVFRPAFASRRHNPAIITPVGWSANEAGDSSPRTRCSVPATSC